MEHVSALLNHTLKRVSSICRSLLCVCLSCCPRWGVWLDGLSLSELDAVYFIYCEWQQQPYDCIRYRFIEIFRMIILEWIGTRYIGPWNVITYPCPNSYNNGPNGHLFYVGGDLMTRRGMLPIIMLPHGDLHIVLHLVPFWILTIWGSVHIEETVVGWRNQLRMKTSAT